MKNLTRIAIIVLPPLLAIVYLFFGNGLELITGDIGLEAQLVHFTLPLENGGINFHIDTTVREDIDGKQFLILKGWVFREDAGSKKRKVYLVLKSESDAVIFKINNNNLKRADVTAAYHLKGKNDGHGFEVSLPLKRLMEPLYQIGFLVEDEKGKNYAISRKLLKIGNDSVSWIVSGSQSDTAKTPPLQTVSITLKKPTAEVACHFDQADVSNGFIRITGWGFLKGFDDRSLKTYLLLQRDETVKIFEVVPRERKDVTHEFSKYGLHLDSTGFNARIPVAVLDPGNYRLGLYIMKGDQQGMLYSNSSLTIGD